LRLAQQKLAMLTQPTFSHFAITVGDLQASLSFYRGVLGFVDRAQVVVHEAPSFIEIGLFDASMTLWFLEREGVVIELQEARGSTGARLSSRRYRYGFRLMAFHVEDVSRALSEVEAGGATLAIATFLGSGPNGIAFFRDHDNQRLEVISGPRAPAHEAIVRLEEVPVSVAESLERVVFSTVDPVRAARFYADFLHCSLVAENDAEARLHIPSVFYGRFWDPEQLDALRGMEVASLPRLEAVWRRTRGSRRGFREFVFRSPDVEAAQRSAIAHGGRVVVDHATHQGSEAVVIDPSGIRIRFVNDPGS